MEFAWMAVTQAWQITVLIGFVLVINRLCARNRPHLAIGVAVVLLAAGRRWLHCLWSLKQAPVVAAPELESLLGELSTRLNVQRRVQLLVTSSPVGPAVMGLFRPLVVLPDLVVRNKLPVDLEAIMAHELIHIRRGDLWLGLLQVGARAVWWFYPVVRWVSRLSTREAERCCDEEVIGELGCDPSRYARSLVEILELKRTLQPVPAFPGMKPVEVTSQRLERVMKLRQGCHKRTPQWCWATMLLFAASALPGAAFIAADDGVGTRSAPASPVDDPLRRSGVAQITVEVRFVAVPEQIVSETIKDWEFGSQGSRLREPIGRPLPTDTTRPSAKVGVTSTTYLPAIYKVVDRQQAAELVKQLQTDQDVTVVAGPKVTLFDGQSATIADAMQRPFVVGATIVGDASRAAQPQVRVVEIGTVVKIRPLL